ncbi:putative bifunctional diguanylate cyclase/phosphodiesterase [Kineococcus sp. SYSU DK006]|uniref:putative bifunctional diguanylate cyclase/phosphodiesterase n=1 Tax=Kineococcus sp. SYSU DK006 TaxID=3383127 RepID=UPI003D7EB547
MDDPGIAHLELIDVVRRFTRTVTGEFSVAQLLGDLVTSALRVLDVDGAGVVVPGPGGVLALASAAPRDVEELERFQQLTQDGPCFDAFRLEQVVTSGDLALEGDWPAYQSFAVEQGVHTVAALPLRGRDGALGVLTVYRRRPRRFSTRDLAAAGALADLAASYLAVTAARDEARAAREELAHLAAHDPLTGLPVRSVFLQRLDAAVAALGPGAALGLLFVDLDGLKYANDTYGHLAGDELIRESARRLRAALRPTDLVARVGGDEFLVLLEGFTTEQATREATAVADRVVREFAAPVSGTGVQPSASIGVVVATGEDPLAPEALVSRADAAMYLAKSRGRGRSALFDPAVYAHASSRAHLVPDLQRALSAGELELHYQPIVDIPSARVSAVEALVRWQHPERGLLAAEEFIEAAEHARLIGALGAWVLQTACRQLAQWDRELGAASPERVFVNVSVHELVDERLEEQVVRSLAQAGLAPGRLVLEVTESGFLDDPRGVAVLSRLRSLGCALAIDDFGSGYSSLGRLVHLPASVLKIDRSFTQALATTAEATPVIASVVRLGLDLGCDVVVEGVEDASTLQRLADVGCRLAQGYHLSRPVPAAQLTAALSA